MWDGFDRTMVVYWSCALEDSISEPLANCSAPERNVREVGPLRGRTRTDRQSLSSNCPSIVLLDRCGIYWVLDARPKINSVPRSSKKLFLSPPEDREERIRLSSYRPQKSYSTWRIEFARIGIEYDFRGFQVGKGKEMRWAKWAKR
jgi:hypothetical protein